MGIIETARPQGGQAPLAPHAGALLPPPGCGLATASPWPAGNAWPDALGIEVATARERGGQAPRAPRVGTSHSPPGCSRATTLPPATGSAWLVSRCNAAAPITRCASSANVHELQRRVGPQVLPEVAVLLSHVRVVPIATAVPVARKVCEVHATSAVDAATVACASVHLVMPMIAITNDISCTRRAGPQLGGGAVGGARARRGLLRPARPRGHGWRQSLAAFVVRSPPIPITLPTAPFPTLPTTAPPAVPLPLHA